MFIGCALIASNSILLSKIIFHDVKGDGEFSVPEALYFVLSHLDDTTITILLTVLLAFIVQLLAEKFWNFARPFSRWVYLGLVVLILAYSVGHRSLAVCDKELGREYSVDTSEKEMGDMVSRLVNNSLLPATRLQHEKSHGCISAQFIVENNIPDYLKHGVFAKPTTYNCIIRYSNGAQKGNYILVAIVTASSTR